MEFSRPEYWSGSLIPSPADLPDPGIKLGSPALQADSLPAELPGSPFGEFWMLKAGLGNPVNLNETRLRQA